MFSAITFKLAAVAEDGPKKGSEERESHNNEIPNNNCSNPSINLFPKIMDSPADLSPSFISLPCKAILLFLENNPISSIEFNDILLLEVKNILSSLELNTNLPEFNII